MQLANTPPLQSTEEANIRLQLTTHFIDLKRMKGWVNLCGLLHTEIKNLSRAKSHQNCLKHHALGQQKQTAWSGQTDGSSLSH